MNRNELLLSRKTFAALLGGLVLTACTHQVTQQTVIDKQGCLVMCQNRLASCKKVCHDNCLNCTLSNNRRMVHYYNRYMHETVVQGKVVMRELQSYRDPLQCRKNTCNCRVDYTSCTQSCTGTIYKRLQVAPVCC